MVGTPTITISISNSAILNNFSYQYNYDARRRMISKKLPGASPVYMVYDDRDRLVLSQDGNQRLINQWTFTKYDALNRPVSTGFYTATQTLSQMQAAVNSYYTGLSTNGGAWYESLIGKTAGNIEGYDNKSFPQVSDTTQYLTVNYYDDPTYILSAWGSNYNYTDDNLTSGTYTQLTAALVLSAVAGHPVGGKVKLLDGSNTWLKSITYYDDHYRVIQTISDNIKGKTDRVSNLYDFPGRLLASTITHQSLTHSPQTVARNFTYDQASRMLQTWHSVNGTTPVLLESNSYNEVGQKVTKSLYSTDAGSTFKQNVDQRYNIRGWLTSINNSSLTSDNGATNSDTTDLFGMNLNYDNAVSGLTNSGGAQYNGNISSLSFSTNLALGTIQQRGYAYTYDPMNRLMAATHKQYSTGWNSSSAFHENNLTYDLNGNILSLSRMDANGAAMDQLTYNYGVGNATGNKLMYVADAGNASAGFVDGNTTGNDYAYDSAGNMVTDKNKKIASIIYNYLNLPQQVTKTTGESIKYSYDATGRKQRQQVYDAGSLITKNTEYDGEFIYQGDTLQFINHEEGRIVMKGVSTPEYQYHLKDHLGNVRTTFTTQRNVDTPVATFETANQNVEQSQFLRMDDARTINATLFDHTRNGVTAYSERLSGSANEKTGIARSISVMPGDTINLTVYAKYVDPNNSNNTAALSQLLTQIIAGTASAGTVIDGASYSTNGITPFPYIGMAGEGNDNTTSGPKAYMNYITFDRNFVPILTDVTQTNFVRMSTAGKEDGTNLPNGNPHEKLTAQLIVKQAGYMYIWLSNEETSPVEVYFDDFYSATNKITGSAAGRFLSIRPLF